MNNKYYNPTIEEFHVGFEYEARIPKMKSFSEEVFHINDSHKELVNRVTIHEGDVRVKHLDREDIESLGLKLWQIPGDSFDWEFYLDNEKGESLGKVTFNDNNTVDELELYGTIFNIKNKSELKRILKQLGI